MSLSFKRNMSKIFALGVVGLGMVIVGEVFSLSTVSVVVGVTFGAGLILLYEQSPGGARRSREGKNGL